MSLGSNLRKIGSPLFVVVAALILMVEDFVWQAVTSAVAGLARIAAVARLEARIARLNPYAAIGLFAIPIALVLPFKLYGTYLIVSGHLFTGLGVIITAKLAGTVVLTRLFQVTRPQLMRVAWFAGFYYWLIRTKRALYERLHALPAWVVATEWLDRFRCRIRDTMGDLRARFNLTRGRGRLGLARLRAARRMLRRAPIAGAAPEPGE